MSASSLDFMALCKEEKKNTNIVVKIQVVRATTEKKYYPQLLSIDFDLFLDKVESSCLLN